MLEDLEYQIYQRMCSHCPNQKRCHDDCDYCDEFLETMQAETGLDNPL